MTSRGASPLHGQRDLAAEDLAPTSLPRFRVAAILGEHRPATQLLGAAEAALQRLDHSADAWTRPDTDHTLAKTRSQLPIEEWDDLYQAGRTPRSSNLLTAAQTSST